MESAVGVSERSFSCIGKHMSHHGELREVCL
jgi:hypothetical protein